MLCSRYVELLIKTHQAVIVNYICDDSVLANYDIMQFWCKWIHQLLTWRLICIVLGLLAGWQVTESCYIHSTKLQHMFWYNWYHSVDEIFRMSKMVKPKSTPQFIIVCSLLLIRTHYKGAFVHFDSCKFQYQ